MTQNKTKAINKVKYDGVLSDDHDCALNERESSVKITYGKIDKTILRTILEFNKSKNIRTVYSCGGHKRKAVDGGSQVYITFEMDKMNIGKFLALAFDKITYEMDRTDLQMTMSRSCCYGWPSGSMERVTISLNDINWKFRQFQVNLARDYFWRLSTAVSELF